jgi:hypothetical protein
MSKQDRTAELEAENAALREQLDALTRQLAPPPPEPEPEPEREVRYLLAVAKPEGVEQFVALAHVSLPMIREQMPEVDWEAVFRHEDLPPGALAIDMVDFIAAGFDRGHKHVHWYRRATDEELAERPGWPIRYQPTARQIAQFKQDTDRLLAKTDELLDASRRMGEGLGPDDDYWLPVGYQKIAKVVLLEIDLLFETFRQGEDWYGIADRSIAKADEHRATMDARAAP